MRIDRGREGRNLCSYPRRVEFANGIPSPAAAGSRVLLTAASDHKETVCLAVAAAGIRPQWTTPHYSGVCTPVVHEGNVYTAHRELRCVDLATGKLVWKGGFRFRRVLPGRRGRAPGGLRQRPPRDRGGRRAVTEAVRGTGVRGWHLPPGRRLAPRGPVGEGASFARTGEESSAVTALPDRNGIGGFAVFTSGARASGSPRIPSGAGTPHSLANGIIPESISAWYQANAAKAMRLRYDYDRLSTRVICWQFHRRPFRFR